MAVGGLGAYRNAIASIESGGNYQAIGPTTNGDRPYGKYQIMGRNIPEWSKEVLGYEVTPEQFLASPQIQDAVFDGKFGGYVAKYGPIGAAQAWLGGPGSVGKTGRKDVLGTSVGQYGQKFARALGLPSSSYSVGPGFRGPNPECRTCPDGRPRRACSGGRRSGRRRARDAGRPRHADADRRGDAADGICCDEAAAA